MANGNGNGNGHRRGNDYTLKDQWEVMLAWIALGNLAEVSRRTGIGDGTCRAWKRANKPRNWERHKAYLEERVREHEEQRQVFDVLDKRRSERMWGQANFEKSAKEFSEHATADAAEAARCANIWNDIWSKGLGQPATTIGVQGEVNHRIGPAGDVLSAIAGDPEAKRLWMELAHRIASGGAESGDDGGDG